MLTEALDLEVRENRRLREELAELQAVFDLRWDADMRAIKRWQEIGGDLLSWPDHADLVVWLMKELVKARDQSTGG